MKRKHGKALRMAACILREDADCLRMSHTVRGQWDDSDGEVRREYDMLRRLADRLDGIATKYSQDTSR